MAFKKNKKALFYGCMWLFSEKAVKYIKKHTVPDFLKFHGLTLIPPFLKTLEKSCMRNLKLVRAGSRTDTHTALFKNSGKILYAKSQACSGWKSHRRLPVLRKEKKTEGQIVGLYTPHRLRFRIQINDNSFLQEII